MRYRTLGRTGWHVSAVAMGCWGLTGHWGPVAEDEAIRIVHTAIDCGVNLFDTTDAYGLGIGEELVGKAVRDQRDSVYIATKVGNFARHAVCLRHRPLASRRLGLPSPLPRRPLRPR